MILSSMLKSRYKRACAILPGLEVRVHARRYQRHGKAWWLDVGVGWYAVFNGVEFADSTDAYFGPERAFHPRLAAAALSNLLAYDEKTMLDIAASR